MSNDFKFKKAIDLAIEFPASPQDSQLIVQWLLDIAVGRIEINNSELRSLSRFLAHQIEHFESEIESLLKMIDELQ